MGAPLHYEGPPRVVATSLFAMISRQHEANRWQFTFYCLFSGSKKAAAVESAAAATASWGVPFCERWSLWNPCGTQMSKEKKASLFLRSLFAACLASCRPGPLPRLLLLGVADPGGPLSCPSWGPRPPRLRPLDPLGAP